MIKRVKQAIVKAMQDTWNFTPEDKDVLQFIVRMDLEKIEFKCWAEYDNDN